MTILYIQGRSFHVVCGAVYTPYNSEILLLGDVVGIGEAQGSWLVQTHARSVTE